MGTSDKAVKGAAIVGSLKARLTARGTIDASAGFTGGAAMVDGQVAQWDTRHYYYGVDMADTRGFTLAVSTSRKGQRINVAGSFFCFGHNDPSGVGTVTHPEHVIVASLEGREYKVYGQTNHPYLADDIRQMADLARRPENNRNLITDLAAVKAELGI